MIFAILIHKNDIKKKKIKKLQKHIFSKMSYLRNFTTHISLYAILIAENYRDYRNTTTFVQFFSYN